MSKPLRLQTARVLSPLSHRNPTSKTGHRVTDTRDSPAVGCRHMGALCDVLPRKGQPRGCSKQMAVHTESQGCALPQAHSVLHETWLLLAIECSLLLQAVKVRAVRARAGNHERQSHADEGNDAARNHHGLALAADANKVREGHGGQQTMG
eukprot:CAMPEP_0185549786 /NCGR_PEP_ID=MMETSP1381-20130426/17583_1 /TAXON_ID=298111 /ORGANISM="Pavlova sp., Strain CCMP459" /LENGTH=150 /DNA_ID=CAMNT_0028162529 /DNA_START=356 /DNA_END=806 /DNA_ORIENTATION=-